MAAATETRRDSAQLKNVQRTNRLAPPAARTLVIGLGNPIVGDDSVGLRVAAQLRRRLRHRRDVAVAADCWGGLRLMERMIGYERVIVVDASCTGAAPGTTRVLSCEEARTQRSSSAHDVDVATALRFGRRAGAVLPCNEDVCFVAIEASNVTMFTDRCTRRVAEAIPAAVEAVLRLLADPQWRTGS